MKEYEKGLVSVVIPTYRRSDMLDRAIQSVLNQSYSHLELLLVNDNEPDDAFSLDLKERVKAYEKDPRFHLVLQEKHVNGAVARNVGIRCAKGEFIAFLDDDDWWEQNKLERQLACLNQLPPEWGGVSCKYSLVDREGNVIARSSDYKDGHVYLDVLRLLTDVTTCSLLLRHKALDETGYFDESLRRHQDFQLLVNFTACYKLFLVREYLLNVDVSDEQNRPDGHVLLEHKRRFFHSVSPVLEKLSKSERRCIFCMHDFEVGYIFLKNRDWKNGLKYTLSVFRSPKALILAAKKVIRKLKDMSNR